MQYIRKTSKNITSNFFIELLKERNIINNFNKEQLKLFFNPKKEVEISPNCLANINAAYEMLMKHLKNKSNIYIVVDCDVDGYTSSAILWLYLTEVMKDIYGYDFTLSYHIPDGKEHGLQTLMNELENDKKYDLIVCPDSSSNDYEEHKILKDLGYDVLVLDHHMAQYLSQDAIVVNNQLSNDYENKDLSGVGIVYKFLEYIDEKEQHNRQYAEDYIDLVMLGIISDMMVLTTLENRYIYQRGLNSIKNEFLLALLDKQSFSIGGDLTQIGIAFYITPLINALIRVGTTSDKEKLFLAFINPKLIVPSTKRGATKGTTETIVEQVVRNCVNAKAKQNREKDKALELLDIQISNNCLDDNKILILNADELDTPNTLTGLCAMGVAAKYKKPVLLGRTNNNGDFKGSGRGRDSSELKDFKGFLMSSNLMEFAEGHSNAFGFAIKATDIEHLINYANEKLKDINFNEGYYEADFVVRGNCSYLSDLITELDNGKEFWGQGCEEPIIAVENIVINKSDFNIIGKNNDTLKFIFNDVTYIKFKATDLIESLSTLPDKINITVIGRGNINTWGNKNTPQILIDEIEIKENNLNDF